MRATVQSVAVCWASELRAVVRDGYACRRCRTLVLDDRDRRAVRANPHEADAVANVLTMCVRCAALHEAGR